MSDPYYHEWAELYDANTRGVPGDIEFYVDLARQADGLVVELGAGTGRIAVPCAEAGARVLGIDLEPAMLAIARRKAEEAGVTARLDLVEGDMRSFDVPEPAALVTIPFRSFLHNLTTEDQLATLGACHRALRPGGLLALNVFNPDLAMMARWMGKGSGHWEPFSAWQGAAPVEGFQAHQEYVPSAQISTTRLRVRDADGTWRKTSIRLRYVHRFEMEHLLARAGFQVEGLHGGFDRSAFREGSPEMVWIARRR